MDRSFRQKLNRGYADGMSTAFEIALIPVVFGGIGWLIDRATGTDPAFTIGLVIFAFVGLFARTWARYDASMAAEESGKVWNRSQAGGGIGTRKTS